MIIPFITFPWDDSTRIGSIRLNHFHALPRICAKLSHTPAFYVQQPASEKMCVMILSRYFRGHYKSELRMDEQKSNSKKDAALMERRYCAVIPLTVTMGISSNRNTPVPID